MVASWRSMCCCFNYFPQLVNFNYFMQPAVNIYMKGNLRPNSPFELISLTMFCTFRDHKKFFIWEISLHLGSEGYGFRWEVLLNKTLRNFLVSHWELKYCLKKKSLIDLSMVGYRNLLEPCSLLNSCKISTISFLPVGFHVLLKITPLHSSEPLHLYVSFAIP